MATAKSQNGWPVQTKPDLWPHPLVGGILAGPVWVVFHWFIAQFVRQVEAVHRSQSGCWNHRKIAGSSKWSNHASATAIDLNWARHPQGHKNTFTKTQRNVIRTLIAKSAGVLRWGAEYTDEMHFEIAPGVSLAAVEHLATKLLQKALVRHGYNIGKTGVDCKPGPATTAALKRFQRDHHLTADGLDGPATWAALDK